MRTALACVFCLLLATPLSATTPDERFTAARHQMRAGDPAAALIAFEALRDEYPRNVDYVFAHAVALSEVGRHDDALTQLDYAIRLSPGYEDVWRTKYNLLVRHGNPDEIDAYSELSAVRFPSSSWWRIAAPATRHPWIVTLGAGIDVLDSNLPNWDRQFAEVRYERNESQSYAVSFSRNTRNYTSDISTGLVADWSTGLWLAGGSFNFADNPEIMPESGIEFYGGRQFGGGWIATIRYRHRKYENASVSSFFASTERYFGAFRIAYDLGVSRLHGASSYLNHVIVGNWYYNETSSIGLSTTVGREAEPIGGGQVLETDVKGISLNGRHQFNQRFGLQWWLGIHDQGKLYRRQFVGMALSIRI